MTSTEYRVVWNSKYGGVVKVIRGTEQGAREIAEAAANNGHFAVRIQMRECPEWEHFLYVKSDTQKVDRTP